MPTRAALKRRVGRLYGLLTQRDAHRQVILLYHSIAGGPWATAVEIFRDHLRAITEAGQLVGLRKLVDSPPEPGIAVAISFDDGYATLKDHAASVLDEFGAAATAFLNVDLIASDERLPSQAELGYYPGEQFMTWRDVEALRVKGWEFGSHGLHHLDLASVDTATARNELSASKYRIEQRLDQTCDMFAYPWGRHSAALRAEVRVNGYRHGFAVGQLPITSRSDPFALPRIIAASDYTYDDLVAILRGDWDYLYWVAKAKAVLGRSLSRPPQ